MGEVASVDEMPVCKACGLMSGELVSPKNPICWECFNRLNWAYAQGPWRYITKSHEKSHETALCPAIQNSTEWYLTRDEHVYLDYERCKHCRSASVFGFNHYHGKEMIV